MIWQQHISAKFLDFEGPFGAQGLVKWSYHRTWLWDTDERNVKRNNFLGLPSVVCIMCEELLQSQVALQSTVA